MKRKYPKTTGWYVYMHRTPEKDCSFGMSQQQPCKRFQPSLYKGMSLQPYIEQFGWDNIEHVVLFDGLTKHQAEVLEDWFIVNATQDGFCINKQRSGGIERDNKKEYNREYQQTEKYKEHRREYDRKRYQNDSEYRERKREYQQTEKYKAYRREYQQTEEYKTKQREYHQRPEVKERQCEYQQTEEYKQYRREYMREYMRKRRNNIKNQ